MERNISSTGYKNARIRLRLGRLYVDALFYAGRLLLARRAAQPRLNRRPLWKRVLGRLLRLVQSIFRYFWNSLRRVWIRLGFINEALYTKALQQLLDTSRRSEAESLDEEYLYCTAHARAGRLGAGAMAVLARAALDRSDTDGATELLDALIARFPTSFSHHQQAGAQCFLKGEYLLAESVWTRSNNLREETIRQRGLDRYNLRFLGPTWSLAIGHIAHIDSYLKQLVMSGVEGRRTILMGHAASGEQNSALIKCFAPFVENGSRGYDGRQVPAGDVEPLMDEFWTIRFEDGRSRMFSHAGSMVQARWEQEGRSPLISPPPEMVEEGEARLRELGIPEGAWFVCFHVREPGFHRAWHLKHPGTRNADVMTYLQAMEAVVASGGYAVRVGDTTMTPLPSMRGVVDYAHSAQKSDLMDIYLCARCRFFVGTNSGLGLVPAVFGVPCAMTNWSPIALPQWYPRDVGIPKLIYSEDLGRMLTLDEMFTGRAGWEQFDAFFEENRLRIVDNTPEDITALVEEMLERAAGTFHLDVDDARRLDAYHRIVEKSGSYTGARPGARFLRRHASVLGLSTNAPVGATANPGAVISAGTH